MFLQAKAIRYILLLLAVVVLGGCLFGAYQVAQYIRGPVPSVQEIPQPQVFELAALGVLGFGVLLGMASGLAVLIAAAETLQRAEDRALRRLGSKASSASG